MGRGTREHVQATIRLSCSQWMTGFCRSVSPTQFQRLQLSREATPHEDPLPRQSMPHECQCRLAHKQRPHELSASWRRVSVSCVPGSGLGQPTVGTCLYTFQSDTCGGWHISPVTRPVSWPLCRLANSPAQPCSCANDVEHVIPSC